VDIPKGDVKFIRETLLPWSGIRKINLAFSDSPAKYPDIWVKLGRIPTITLTAEWQRQNAAERRKRLLHECLHILGMSHNEKIGYSTYPDRDTYSKRLYKELVCGNSAAGKRGV